MRKKSVTSLLAASATNKCEKHNYSFCIPLNEIVINDINDEMRMIACPRMLSFAVKGDSQVKMVSMTVAYWANEDKLAISQIFTGWTLGNIQQKSSLAFCQQFKAILSTYHT